MENFIQRLKSHIEHVKKVGEHCTTEETTKQALILPLLDILGFNPYDPTKVLAEFAADFPGVKATERVDYALYCNGQPVMFIEAKPFVANLTNHAPQLSRYFNSSLGVTIGAITNGREWRFFTDLINTNVMDEKPFLTIDFTKANPEDLTQLAEFKHDNFHAEKLRFFAEENQYIQQFKAVIKKSINEVDIDFVRYVAQQASIQRQLNTKFLESIQPFVKQAVQQAISDTVVKGLSSPTVITAQPVEQKIVEPKAKEIIEEKPDFIVNPDNEKIITTKDEQELLRIVNELLPGVALEGRDTESYYSVLFQGKTNRWLFRYDVNRKRHTIQFIVPIDDLRRSELERAGLEVQNNGQIFLEKPEYIYRMVGVLKDSLEHCMNDENFKRTSS
ncbi:MULTISPECIES: type I restriction endonuclease [Acinetobacter]|jgi:predicted type IV restriction endonuclease|nr:MULTISPECIES: type I restriction endonuclease [Acinetobacter]EXB72960.1 type I restriction enzyme R protein [Acinetobacter sp. 230853]MCK4082168.1 type I restriction endonuclease subunit R [Acinetobacter radioresistens]MCK4090209.1 type I restriction endonuclease subunit R [Acinetobacter radioresistens]MCM1936469.1 type I restriction endonuclease [Acinetobacter radioresistens]MCM1954135.1 type I restriction endonuclease [Acinetobacter radioresistens]